jgi:hypothetical protein
MKMILFGGPNSPQAGEETIKRQFGRAGNSGCNCFSGKELVHFLPQNSNRDMIFFKETVVSIF